MRKTAADGRSSARLRSRPLLWAFVASRLIVWTGAVGGALLTTRVDGWTMVDPGRMSTSFGRVGNVLSAPAVRWDSIGYLNIAAHGYTQARETILFPLYPLAIAALGWAISSDVIAGILISSISFAVGLILLHRLTELELGRRAADAAVLLLMFAPVSLFFSAVYTESLFLALSVGSIYAARRGHLLAAAALAALAAVTRVTGVLLVVPIALLAVQRDRRVIRRLAWLALVPAVLGGFLAYMAAAGYGWLAPLRNQKARQFGGPFATIVSALKAAGHGVSVTVSGLRPVSPSLESPFSAPFDSVVLLVVLILAAAALVLVLRRLELAYSAYAALALLACIASQTEIQPLEGLDRYALTIFPLWMATGAWAAQRRALHVLVPLGALLLAFYSYEFATWAFIA